MKCIEIFDPAMCCSTGVCGAQVDPALPRFAADLDWLKHEGVEVHRFNLAQQPQAFADNPLVAGELNQVNNLPIIVIGGVIVSRGGYPSRQELAAWLGLGLPAAGEAVSGGCKPGGGCC
ncbi:MAG TPA: arsenical resistance operon transcriptional repressor ArsD [Betaproteobacteria bacterium]|nr:arsenical resistance operon transcriptional repressor ArsD [Betaproteobacteria bacterium]